MAVLHVDHRPPRLKFVFAFAGHLDEFGGVFWRGGPLGAFPRLDSATHDGLRLVWRSVAPESLVLVQFVIGRVDIGFPMHMLEIRLATTWTAHAEWGHAIARVPND